MNFIVHVDWKFVVALGVAVASIVLATKADAKAAERVLTHAVNARGEYVIAGDSSC